jgi:Enoyl-CoA hydratase/isomerase
MTDVLVEVDDLVAMVTLNRPERRNAISGKLLARLREAVADLNARADVRAIVLTGSDPAFCAGLDLTELGQPGGPLAGAGSGAVIPELTIPMIGAVNGAAVTGGLKLALACDFLVASDRATFADTHARVGVMPGWGLTVALPEAVGLRRAREMSATGNFISARTALISSALGQRWNGAWSITLCRTTICLPSVVGSLPTWPRPTPARCGRFSPPTRRVLWSQAGRRGRSRLGRTRTSMPGALTRNWLPAAATRSPNGAANSGDEPEGS